MTTIGRLKSLFYKSLLFLSLNLLLLPAAAATSVQGILVKLTSAESPAQFAAQVIVEGPSQLFISVLLQSAFISSGFQLLHVPERLVLLWGKIASRIRTDSAVATLENWSFPCVRARGAAAVFFVLKL